MQHFVFHKLEIPEVILVTPRTYDDDRGFFFEFYHKSEYDAAGINEKFVQDNESHSVKGTLRGLHYQKNPKAQGKLVRCVKGEIFDVAVDIRKGSPNYGKWVGEILSGDNKLMLWIPPGFAHGFVVLSENAEVHYKTTEEYSHENESGIIWNDPEINVDWPVNEPLVSEKDKKWPQLKDADNNFSI